jgi:Trypsin
LISDRYVLTAAHCLTVNLLDWQLISVRLGEFNISTQIDCVIDSEDGLRECGDPPIDVIVSEQIIHEGYDKDDQSRHHDIALLRLAQPITYTSKSQMLMKHSQI